MLHGVIDVGFDKLGTAAGAALALALTAPSAPPTAIYGLVVLSSLVALALCRRPAPRGGRDRGRDHPARPVPGPANPRGRTAPTCGPSPPQGSDSDLAPLQEVLAGRSPCGLELVPKLIACLARDDTTSTQAPRVLRGLAHRVMGRLADALLDPESPAAVRRLVPRALRACATRRSAEALVLGLLDPALRSASSAPPR
jgi:hypothetical protein